MKFTEPMLAVTAPTARLVALCEDDVFGGQQKVDGDRLLMHVEDDVVRPMSRQGLHLVGVRPLVLSAFRGMKGRWVFDGEYLDGVYHLFDLLEGAGKSFYDTPFAERYATLEHFYASWKPLDVIKLLPMAWTHEEKCELAAHVIDEGLEGLVFKRIDSKYRAGKHGDDWLRVKFRNEIDCFVTRLGVGGHDNMELAVYRDGEPVVVGECTAHAGDGRRVKVGDVVTVLYQYASIKNGKLQQPTLPKIRQDKRPDECLFDQIVWENKTVRA